LLASALFAWALAEEDVLGLLLPGVELEPLGLEDEPLPNIGLLPVVLPPVDGLEDELPPLPNIGLLPVVLPGLLLPVDGLEDELPPLPNIGLLPEVLPGLEEEPPLPNIGLLPVVLPPGLLLFEEPPNRELPPLLFGLLLLEEPNDGLLLDPEGLLLPKLLRLPLLPLFPAFATSPHMTPVTKTTPRSRARNLDLIIL